MGEITCQLNADAIKPTILYCSEPEAYRLNEWMAGSAIFSALGTVVLAVFAIAAWRSSVRNLKDMERHNQASIRANQELAVQSRQIQYLAKYCNALMDLSNAAGDPKANLEPLQAAATATWATWAMELFRIDPEFRDITGKWNTVFKDRCEALQKIIAKEIDNYGMSLTKIAEYDTNRAMVGNYFGKLQIWQVDAPQRDEVKARLIANYRASK